MATIRRLESAKTGRVSWQAIVRRKGHPPEYATFPTRTKAERWARKTESAIEEGRHQTLSEAEKHTLAEAAQKYFDDVLPELRSAFDRRRHIEWLVERAGSYSLARVTPAMLSEYRDELAATPGSRRKTLPGPAMINRHIASWSALFSTCVKRWHWIPVNPAMAVEKIRGEKARDRFLSEDERDRLIAACTRSKNEMLLPAVLVSLSSGGRKSEVMRLRWRDVDLENGTGRVARSKNDDPKTLHIRGRALEELKRWRERTRHAADADYVFPARGGTGVAELRTPWEHALVDAGIRDFRWHDLRHSTGSFLAMAGATPSEIAEILGHRSLAMVKRYTKIADQHSRSVVDRMTEKFGL